MHFAGREALAQQFANASLHQLVKLTLVGLDDASNRRYFRVQDLAQRSYILMDAPPELEDASQFVRMANKFAKCGQSIPKIFYVDDENGFVLMQDFGDQWLHTKLMQSPQTYMPKALDLLSSWQRQTNVLQTSIPNYGKDKLLSEMALLQEWFLPFIDVKLHSVHIIKAINEEQQRLVDILLKQPQVCVHRDFHSRNLMWQEGAGIGIIDFQDALWGGASYDLVSLTRDCYIEYELDDVHYWERSFGQTNFSTVSSDDWLGFCELTSLQRHMKVLGLFVRLAQKAGKTRYLQDLPLVLKYALREAEQINKTMLTMQMTVNVLSQAIDKLPKKIKAVV